MKSTRPKISRRHLLTGLPFLPATLSRGMGAKEDPILSLCRRWHATQELFYYWCRRKQRLETELMRRHGFPHIYVTYRGKRHFVTEEAEIDQLLQSSSLAKREALKKELAHKHHLWDEAALACGYSEAEKQEEAQLARLEYLTHQIAYMSASTIAGLLAKLQVAVAIGKDEPNDADHHPWVFIHSAFEDLKRLSKIG